MYLAWNFVNMLFLAGLIAAVSILAKKLRMWFGLMTSYCAFGFIIVLLLVLASHHPPPVRPSIGPSLTGGVFQRAFVQLEDNRTSALDLIATYRVASDSLQLVAAQTVATGFLFGQQWRPATVQLRSNGRTVAYVVRGTLNWNLLGLSIYQQNKLLTGVFRVH